MLSQRQEKTDLHVMETEGAIEVDLETEAQEMATVMVATGIEVQDHRAHQSQEPTQAQKDN
jgi:hypothetical protein